MWEQIRRNKRNSVILLALMALILCLLGWLIGELVHPGAGPFGVAGAVILWAVLVLVAFSGGDKIMLSMAGARQIEHSDHPQLHNVVEEMTIASGLPKPPKVYIIDDEHLNAFAVGKPGNCCVAITSGLLMKLNRDELQGVMAHEIGHVVNNDTRFMVLTGITVGAIVLLSDGLLRMLFYTGGGRRGSRRRSSGGGQGQAVLVIVAIVAAILGPVLAHLLYFACSRKREYLADACSAQYTRYPEGLASALEKISGSYRHTRNDVKQTNRVTAPMYTVNPLEAAAKKSSLFSTHPATGDRVRILRNMGGAGFGDYQAAFRKAHTGQGIIGQQSLTGAGKVAIREPLDKPTEAPKDNAGKTRQVVDMLHRMNQFVFLTCVCGLKMKFPPKFKGKEVDCPRCGRHHQVPVKDMAVAAAAATAISGGADPARAMQDAMTGGGLPGMAAGTRAAAEPTPPPQPEMPEVTLTGRGWQSFRCPLCNAPVQVSPKHSAPTIDCKKCGRPIGIKRGGR